MLNDLAFANLSPQEPLGTRFVLSGDTTVLSRAALPLVFFWFVQVWEETPRVGKVITAFKIQTKPSITSLAFIVCKV